jgi:hypothetical protein
LIEKYKKDFNLYFSDFVIRFLEFARSLYEYYEKISKGVDFCSMDGEYKGSPFLADCYIEKKDAGEFEFN